MNPKLKNYLQKLSPSVAGQPMLDDLCKEMEKAVPEITDSIRRREELAAELRIASSKPSKSKPEGQD